MASKYDITSGLSDYESLYYDVGVDKYIESIKSLRDTYDKNVAGSSLLKEGVAKMNFMPGDEYGRTYLEDGVENILGSVMDAPEDATSSVNKAMQFYTSDPVASAFRRNATEYEITKQMAIQTPGGFSSMLMFGQDPNYFRTLNDDGSINKYQHQAEQRLDQESKFIKMVGTIAQSGGKSGTMFEDLNNDQIYDVLTTYQGGKGVSNSKADKIVKGLMEQFVTSTPEGIQALREITEMVNGKPPLTEDRDEALKILFNRFRPLIENQVGWTSGSRSSSALGSGDGSGSGGSGDMFKQPSILLDIMRGNTTTIDKDQQVSIGIESGTTSASGTRLLSSFAAMPSLGFLNEVSGSVEITPGWKPFEGLNDNLKATKVMEIMQIANLIQTGRQAEAAELAKTLPGFVEAYGNNKEQLLTDIEKFTKSVSGLEADELYASMGMMYNWDMSGGIQVPGGKDLEIKKVNEGGVTTLYTKVPHFYTEDQVDLQAQSSWNDKSGGVGQPGAQFFSFLPGGEPAFGQVDIDELKYPGTNDLIYRRGTYRFGSSATETEGYYVDIWMPKEVNTKLQETLDQDRVSIGTTDAAESAENMKNQVGYYQDLQRATTIMTANYSNDGVLPYLSGNELQEFNIRPYITKGSNDDRIIQSIIGSIPEASIQFEVLKNKGKYPKDMTSTQYIYGILAQVKMAVSQKMDDKARTTKLNNLYNMLTQ